MAGWQILLEIALVGLLMAMLFHAARLERALGVVRRDRAELEALLQSFSDSTQHAESGITQLRTAADGVGRQIARQIDVARTLKDDLAALTERGESVADRMDNLVRSNRAPEPVARRSTLAETTHAESGFPRVRSQAERDLLRALRVTR